MTMRPKRKTASRRITKAKKHSLTRRHQGSLLQRYETPTAGVRNQTTGNLPLELSHSRVSSKSAKATPSTCHPDLLADMAYLRLSDKMALSPELLEMAVPAVLDFQKQMYPRDALERLALAQVLLAHGRVAWLSKLLVGQTQAPALAVISEATERAAGTFGRLMRAIAEYRQPEKMCTTVSIGQANLAHQQVVQNVKMQKGLGKRKCRRTN